MLSDDGKYSSSPQSDGGVSRGGGNREFGTRHSGSNRSPCRDGRGTVHARIVILGEDNTLRGRGKEDEESNIEDDRNDSPNKLSDELILRLGPEEVTRLEVTGHIRSLSSSSSGNNPGGQVEGLSRSYICTGGFADTTKNQLGSLCDSANWVDVRGTRTLDTDEGEEETEGESK